MCQAILFKVQYIYKKAPNQLQDKVLVKSICQNYFFLKMISVTLSSAYHIGICLVFSLQFFY